MRRSDTVVTTPAPDPAIADSDSVAEEPPRWQRVLTLVVGAAIIGYALIGIGSALFGLKVFAATDMMADRAPYVNSGLAGIEPQNTYLNDTVDSVVPNTTLFGHLFRQGEVAEWNPYQAGGTAFGSTPNNAVFNPLTAPYLVLPGWLAPGYVKLFEILVAAGGTFLFLRRFRLGRSASLLGGLIFVASGFMIAWTNWPQTRVAAFIPAVFWCVETLVQERRARDAAMLCLAMASMLFGGFPAITGYTILFAGLYLVVRVLAEPGAWRRRVGVVLGAGAALGGAAALAAFQLAPFVSAMSGVYIRGRAQTPNDHLSPVTMLTAVAPWAFGTTDPNRGPYWYLMPNLVESTVYVGAAAVLLALVAIAWPRAAWARLPRGGWTFFVLAAGLTIAVAYGGRAPLAVLQKLPVLFSDNYIGRIRSVLGFLVAVLAAVGFDLLVRRLTEKKPQADASVGRFPGWVWVAWPVLLFGGAAGLLAGLVWRGRRAADLAHHGAESGRRVSWFDGQMVWAAAFLLLAAAGVVVLWRLAGRDGRGRGRRVLTVAAAILVPLLVMVQGLTFAEPYWPKSDKATFYPETDVHRWLADHLGDDRYAAGGAMFVGSDSVYQLRALNGHAFVGDRFAQALEAMPGWNFGDPPTYIGFRSTLQAAEQPLFNRLGVKYFVTSPWDQVFGTAARATGAGAPTTIRPGTAVTFPVPGSGGVRAISLTVADAFYPTANARIRVTVRDAAGKQVAAGERQVVASDDPDGGVPAGSEFTIPVAAEQVPATTRLTATITVEGPSSLVIRGHDGPSAIGTVHPADDGLRLVYAGPAVVYQRLDALPRIRWAGRTLVEPDAAKRIALVNSATLPADEVVLDKAGTPVSGSTAKLDVTDDGVDAIETRVDASGTGYLVVADALQTDWAVTVDGKPATLVPADHGLVAVEVPAGAHTVRLAYRTPYHSLGTWISAVTALVLLAILVGLPAHRRWQRRRPA